MSYGQQVLNHIAFNRAERNTKILQGLLYLLILAWLVFAWCLHMHLLSTFENPPVSLTETVTISKPAASPNLFETIGR